MCLAVPGKIIETDEIAGVRIGRVDFGGVTRQACLDYVPEAQLGDFVMVHVGFAITKVDEAEAHRSLELLEKMGLLAEELGGPGS